VKRNVNNRSALTRWPDADYQLVERLIDVISIKGKEKVVKLSAMLQLSEPALIEKIRLWYSMFPIIVDGDDVVYLNYFR
jgi:hypothetical protein